MAKLIRTARGKMINMEAIRQKASVMPHKAPATEEVKRKVKEVERRVQSGFVPKPPPIKSPAQATAATFVKEKKPGTPAAHVLKSEVFVEEEHAAPAAEKVEKKAPPLKKA